MNRREFLKFLGGTAAVVAVAPKALADALDVQQAYPVTSPCPATFGAAIQATTEPAASPGFIVLDPNTMTIQQAIDALPKDGGTVYIPSGIYVVNQTISIPRDVQLVAEGSVAFESCVFGAEFRAAGDAPITFLMDEDDQVTIRDNSFDCEKVRSMQAWFEVPIGDHLADLREKMRRLCLKMKKLVT